MSDGIRWLISLSDGSGWIDDYCQMVSDWLMIDSNAGFPHLNQLNDMWPGLAEGGSSFGEEEETIVMM